MKQILVYADSLSWGIIPETRRRLPFDQRWPGVLEHALLAAGRRVRVIEDCLNGRRTVFDDPFKPGRNGAVGLSAAECIHLNLGDLLSLRAFLSYPVINLNADRVFQSHTDIEKMELIETLRALWSPADTPLPGLRS